MKRCLVLLSIIALTLVSACGTNPRPNLILLLADDMGYADISCFGSRAVQTPNIDALAESGKSFTQFYAAAAVCTPTRASVLSGRYPIRFGITKHFPDDESHLPRDTVTLPKLLQQAGYGTAHVGKWHLGGLHQKHIDNRNASIPGPMQHGFDHYLTQLEDPPIRIPLGRENRMYRDGGKHLVRDDANAPPDARHFTDINGDEAIAYIEQFHNEDKPFFINLWWLVPHKPYEPAPEPHLSQYADGAEGDQLLWRSMVSHMDAKIGQIVAKLKELGIYNNTFIIFTSDNGAAFEGDTGIYKGGKTDLHEGGIRVPLIALWPGHIPPGTTTTELGHSNDLLLTFCDAAGVRVPNDVTFDGRNLLPHMTTGEPVKARGTVFWQLDLYKQIQRHFKKPKPYATEVVRRDRWKMLANGGVPVELFDVEADPREQNNVLGKQPALTRRLTEELNTWLAEPRQSCLP